MPMNEQPPWGKKKQSSGPEDLLAALIQKIRDAFDTKDKEPGRDDQGGIIPPSPRSPLSGPGKIGAIVAAFFAVQAALASFYTIKPGEVGVVLRFGEYSHNVDPGLRWKPTFIDRVIPVDVESVRSLPASGFMLTQDENVVRVEMDVQYRVVDPEQYLFSVTNADESLSQATDSALRYVVGHTRMDDVLTTGREKVRQETWQVIDSIIEPYQMGLQIVDVLPARPPEEVKDAFDDAISAQEDEQRFIREAEAYAREVEPKARGQVKRLEQEAEAYKSQIVLKAKGEVARFNELLPQYQAAPELTRDRIYLETMEELYQQANKVVVDMPAGNNSMIYLPLDKLSGKANAVQPARPAGTPAVEAAQPSNEGANSTPTPLRGGDRFSTGRN